MGRRYSDIKRAKELELALTNYKTWIDESFDNSKRKTGGTVGAAKKRTNIYVKAFGTTGDVAYKASRSIDSNVRLGTMDGRVFDEPTGAGGTYNVFAKGQSPCRVSLFEGTGGRTYEQSKVTGLFYIKYAGDTYSSPIGRTATEGEPAGVASAFTHLRSLAAGKDYVRVWHKPEDLISSRN